MAFCKKALFVDSNPTTFETNDIETPDVACNNHELYLTNMNGDPIPGCVQIYKMNWIDNRIFHSKMYLVFLKENACPPPLKFVK